MARKLTKFFKSKAFPALVLLACVIGIASIVGTSYLSTVNLDISPDTFQPTRVSSTYLDVSASSNHQDVLGSNIVYSYSDPAGNYPDVDMFQSQPYMSDAAGNEIAATNGTILATSKRLVIGDTVLYLHEYFQTIQIGARTRLRLHDPGNTATYVSPFAGQSFATRDYVLGSTTYPHATVDGVLTLYDCRDTVNNYYYTSGSDSTPYMANAEKAMVTSSLYPVYFPTIQVTRPTGAFTPDEVLGKVKNSFGNREVFAYPTVNIAAQTDYLSYKGFSYQVTLPNGTVTTVTIDTTSATVGFTNVYRTGADIKGIVPNTIPVAVNERTPFSTTEPSGEKSLVSQTEKDYVIETTLNGWIHPGADMPAETSGGQAEIRPATTSLDRKSIEVKLENPGNDFNLEQNLVITPELRLQPVTTIYKTTASIGWSSLRRTWYAFGMKDDDYTLQGIKNVWWPYGVNVQSVYAISQYTFKVLIVTANQISMITAGGSPIDVTKITDFNIATIIKDPSVDLTDVDLSLPPERDFWGFMGDLFTGIGGVAMIGLIIVAIIAGLWLFSKVGGTFKGIAKNIKKIFKGR